jgi:predicted aldo/keto reductase-like oxidoreductase
MKQIYNHDMSLTQVGDIVWSEVQSVVRNLFDSVPDDINFMHVSQLMISAITIETYKRLLKNKHTKIMTKLPNNIEIAQVGMAIHGEPL